MNPPPVKTDPHAAEIERIRAEYLRRAVEIPPDFYGWSQEVNQFFHTQTYRACLEALVRESWFPLQGCRIADIGCGDGTWLLEFAQWGADPVDLFGIDLDETRITAARRRLPASELVACDAHCLPWPSGSFDLVSQFTLLTSVLATPVKQAVAGEMLRVLKPGGIILWYDFQFNNPRNPNVRGIKATEIRSLFPGCDVKLTRVTLAPPIARLVVPTSWILALLLEKLPFLRTHYLGIVQKSAS